MSEVSVRTDTQPAPFDMKAGQFTIPTLVLRDTATDLLDDFLARQIARQRAEERAARALDAWCEGLGVLAAAAAHLPAFATAWRTLGALAAAVETRPPYRDARCERNALQAHLDGHGTLRRYHGAPQIRLRCRRLMTGAADTDTASFLRVRGKELSFFISPPHPAANTTLEQSLTRLPALLTVQKQSLPTGLAADSANP